MRWQTKVETGSLDHKIHYNDKITLLGSCFASEIGNILQDLRFNTCVNPFGVMFNPASIASSLGRLETGTNFQKEDVFKEGTLYKSFYHGSEFAAGNAEDFLESNNKILEICSAHFMNSKFVILTLGTSWVYKEKKSMKVVSNCHKLPASDFQREFLSYQESVELLAPFIERYNHKEWIVTVSPVRHLKDGAHGNQLSKSNLLIAANKLVNRFANVSYFPAYEIFMDELRDYRFYGSDMVHPSADAVKYIWEKFRDFAISKECDKKLKAVESLNLMRNHKPLFPGTTEHYSFLEKIKELECEISKL